MIGTIWLFSQEEGLLGIHHCGIIFYWFFSFKQQANVIYSVIPVLHLFRLGTLSYQLQLQCVN